MPFEIDVQLDLGGTLVLKRSQVGIKIDQKSVLGGIKNRSWDVLAGSLERSWWPKPNTEEGNQFFGGLLGPSWRVRGAILGSCWPSKGNQERRKIDPKIDQNFVACWVRFLDRCW